MSLLVNPPGYCWVGIIQQLVVSLSPWYKEVDFNNEYYFNAYFSTNNS